MLHHDRLVCNERQEADCTCAFDCVRQFPLVLCTCAGDAAWKNLTALCHEAAENIGFLIVDLALVCTETADLLLEESLSLSVASATGFIFTALVLQLFCCYFIVLYFYFVIALLL